MVSGLIFFIVTGLGFLVLSNERLAMSRRCSLTLLLSYVRLAGLWWCFRERFRGVGSDSGAGLGLQTNRGGSGRGRSKRLGRHGS